MARPERKDADYFPFYCKDGRTLFILESKYQCKGTGFFTNVMRFLTTTPNHHTCIKLEADRLYFFSKVKCDEESGIDMLNLMATTRKIHPDLWASHQVIVSQDLLDSLVDAYKNRRNKIIAIDDIVNLYPLADVSYPDNTPCTGLLTKKQANADVSYPDNPQRKGKERKGKESIETVIPDWIPREPWDGFIEMRKEIKKPLTGRAITLAITKLTELKNQGHDPGKVLDQSTMAKWQGLFELKYGGSNGGIRTNRSDPRDKNLQSREDAEVAANIAQWEAAKKSPGNNAGRDAKNDDAPDFLGV